MKNLFWLLVPLLLFSCEKDELDTSNSELWLKVGSSIESLVVSFTGENAGDVQNSYVINYTMGAFDSEIKVAKDTRDGEEWTLVHTSNEKSGEIVVTSNNKQYKTTGFGFKEKRLLEITESLEGEITIHECDITMIEQIIWVN
jgi:hypothetical protein